MAPFIGWCDNTQCGTLRCREREPSTPSVAFTGSMSIRRCSGPCDPRYGMLTFRVLWRRLSVLKSGTSRSRPIRCSRLLTKPVVCLSAMPISTFMVGQVRIAASLSTALAGRRSLPGHGGIEPDRQQAASPERCVIGWPVPGLIGGGVSGKSRLKLSGRVHEKIHQSTPLFRLGLRVVDIIHRFYSRTVIQRQIVASPALWNTVW